MAVLRAVTRVLEEMYADNVMVEIPTLTDSSAAPVKRLAPGAQRIPMIRAVYDMTQI